MAGPQSDDHLRLLLRHTVSGDRRSFTELFDTMSGPLFADVSSLVPEHSAGCVLAQTFVEVWRLARHHVQHDGDTAEWIRQIAARRVAELRNEPGHPPSPSPSNVLSPAVLDEIRARMAAMELTRLLGRPYTGHQPSQVLVANLISGGTPAVPH